FASLLYLRFAVPLDGLALADDPLPRIGERLVAEDLAWRRHPAVRREEGRGGLPLTCEEILQACDGVRNAWQKRMALFRIVDRRCEHVGRGQRAIVAQQLHPGVERARYRRGKHAVAGDELQAFILVVLKRRAGWRRSLAAKHLRLAGARRVEDDQHFAGGTDQMRLDNLQHEGGRDGGVERVAALFQRSEEHTS